MGKRKHKEKNSKIKKKIRRLERRLHSTDSSDSLQNSQENYNIHKYKPASSDRPSIYLTDTDDSTPSRVKSVVTPVSLSDTVYEKARYPSNIDNTKECVTLTAHPEPGPSTSTVLTNVDRSLPDDILEALGDPKGREEVFGPDIPEEIAERWGRILIHGLSKEQKQTVKENIKIPNNFRLIKAPLLNVKVMHVVSESVKNRDKLLEKAQNHLGQGLAGLTYLASNIIQGDMTKIEILKNLSDVCQIFLDLHHDNTNTRRKLVVNSLDKTFYNIINDVERDTYLFGSNLGEKIKASKTAEKSGLQVVKRKQNVQTVQRLPQKHSTQQGNWRGPPRSLAPRRQGGQTHRFPNQGNRRPPPSTDRAAPVSKTHMKSRKT